MSERERFETWAKTEWPELKGTRFPEGYGDFSGKYLSDKMQHAWEGWQAALAEHAKVCAGVWVPVGERLPSKPGVYPMARCRTSGEIILDHGLWAGATLQWVDMHILTPMQCITHWLDVRMPTAEACRPEGARRSLSRRRAKEE